MSLSTHASAILTATQELERKWVETREQWRDAKAREFEEKYLTELFATVERTALVLEEIDKLITQARRSCE
jgi:hypothetical protein